MKYNGIELEEMSSEDWSGKTRQMLVWNNNDDNCHLTYVVGYKHVQIVNHNFIEYNVVWLCSDGYYWSHCAEIPEETKQEQNVDEIIKVLNAYKAGKKIECRFKDRSMRDSWSYMEKPDWNWALYEYRIKQEPRRMTYKELDNWLEQGKGVIRIAKRVSNTISYDCEDRNREVSGYYKICGYDEDTWHEPLIEE